MITFYVQVGFIPEMQILNVKIHQFNSSHSERILLLVETATLFNKIQHTFVIKKKTKKLPADKK